MDDHLTSRRATRRPGGTRTVLAATEQPRIRTEAIHFFTSTPMEFFDLTEDVRSVVEASGVRHGQVTVHTPHTTTSVILNESETGFLNDFRRLMDALVPCDEATYYEHDDHELRTENLQEDEFLNGHSHCRQLLTGSSSVTIPVVDGEVLLGTWQRVLFAELDQARERRVMIHAQGV